MVSIDCVLLFETITHLSARTETEKQVKGHSQAVYQGYTMAEGGRDAAERAYEDYVRSKQSESAVPGGQGDVDEKQDA